MNEIPNEVATLVDGILRAQLNPDLQFDVPVSMKILNELKPGDQIHISDPGRGGSFTLVSIGEPFKKHGEYRRTITVVPTHL